MPEAQAEDLVAALKDAGLGDAAKVGEIVDGPAEKIRVA
jgi:hydrogenase maturation factor